MDRDTALARLAAVEREMSALHAERADLLVAVASSAPVVEELVFRGLLYGWLEGRWGSRVAFVVSSLAFAAAHIELKHVVLVLPLGFVFGWLRRRTNSLMPSVAAHIVNNGFALAAAAWFGP